MKAGNTTIWKNVNFVKAFAAYGFDDVGTWFDLLAIQLLFVSYWHASGLMAAMIFVVYMLPVALFSQFMGMFVDRFNKAKLLGYSSLLSGLITIALLYSTSPLMAVGIIFLRSMVLSVAAPCQHALTKTIVSEEHLLKASSYQSLLRQLCKVAGPLTGAVLVSFFSPWVCIKINAICFFLSAVLLFTVFCNKQEKGEGEQSVMSEMIRGWKLLIKNKKLFYSLLLLLVIIMLVMFSAVEMSLLLKAYRPSQHQLLGYVLAISGLGSATSAYIISNNKNTDLNYSAYIFLGTLLMSISYLIFGFYHIAASSLYLYIAALIEGLGFGITIVMYGYIIKKESAADSVGKIVGVSSSLQAVFLLLGTLCGGILVNVIGVIDTFRLVAITLSAISVMMLFLFIGQAKLRFAHKHSDPDSMDIFIKR